MRTIFYYRCDGGINPGHHHPKTIEVVLDDQYPDRVYIGNKGFGFISKISDQLIPKAEEHLKEQYDSIVCTGVSVRNYKSLNVKVK